MNKYNGNLFADIIICTIYSVIYGQHPFWHAIRFIIMFLLCSNAIREGRNPSATDAERGFALLCYIIRAGFAFVYACYFFGTLLMWMDSRKRNSKK